MLITSGYALYYLYRLLEQPYDPDAKITNYALFWTSCGLLFFNVVGLMSFGLINYLYGTYGGEIGWVLRYVANLVLYTLILLSFLGKQRSLAA